MNSASVLGTLLPLLLVLCGCSQPQKRLAERLRDADRLVFATRVMGDDFSITLRGKEIGPIIDAIKKSRELNPNVSCSPGARLEFFRGSAQLETIHNCSAVFWIDHTPYEDRSKTLEKLDEKCREKYIELKTQPNASQRPPRNSAPE